MRAKRRPQPSKSCAISYLRFAATSAPMPGRKTSGRHLTSPMAWAYHQAQIPVADPESEPCLRFVQTDLYNGHLDEVAQLRCIQEDLKGQLDSMSEMSEMTSLRLQMAM